MLELIGTFDEALRGHGAARQRLRRFDASQLGEFMKEAYRINKHISELLAYLKSIRQPYLSIAHPVRRQQQQHARREPNGAALLHGGERKQLTEGQRTQVDAEAKQLLRELNAAVQRLSDTEQVRQSTELTIQLKKRARKRLGPVGRWAAGGAAAAVPASPEEELDRDRARAVKMHREGVIWYLQQKLQQCGQFQSTMMGIRLSREMERNKTTLYNVRGALPRPDSFVGSALPPAIEAGAGWESANGSNQAASRAALGADEADSKVAGEALSADQLQMLQQENTDLLKHYEDSLDRIRTTEQSLVEISELQTTLANNLAVQSAHIDQLVEDSHHTTENVGQGNQELKRATERRSTAQLVFYVTSAFCATLIVWDWFI